MLHLHSKVVGDIDASQKKVQKKNLTRTIGNYAMQQLISTDKCVPFHHNRDTNVSWATKCLAEAGGFDWKLFGSIEGIENTTTGEIEIWDGLGRLCMAQLAGVPLIPVLVHKQGSPGALFVKKQKLKNRSLNQEAFFVAAASSYLTDGTIGDDKTDKLLKRDLDALKTIGMRIESGVGNYFPQAIILSTHPTVKVNALRRALAIADNDVKIVKQARDWIFQAYPKSDYIGKELLEGATLLFAACPDAAKNGTYKALCEFLKSQTHYTQDKLPFKKMGGNQHNDEARSVAFGIVEMFKTSKFGQGRPSQVLRDKHIKEFKRPDSSEE